MAILLQPSMLIGIIISSDTIFVLDGRVTVADWECTKSQANRIICAICPYFETMLKRLNSSKTYESSLTWHSRVMLQASAHQRISSRTLFEEYNPIVDKKKMVDKLDVSPSYCESSVTWHSRVMLRRISSRTLRELFSKEYNIT